MVSRTTLSIIPLLVAMVIGVACSSSAPSPTTAPSGPAATAPSAPDASGGDVEQGQELFAVSCSGCHGQDAKGLPGVGKDLTDNEFIEDLDNQELVDFIKKGRSASDPENTTGLDMPPKGGNPALTDAQLADIAAYLHSLQ